MKRIFAFFLILAMSAGCAPTSQVEQITEANSGKLRQQSQSRSIEVLDEAYLGAVPIEIPKSTPQSPALATRITLRMNGDLTAICDTITRMTGLPIQVEPAENTPAPAAAQEQKKLPSDLELPALGTETASSYLVDYDGQLRALLDILSTHFGMGWEYDSKANSVTYTRMQVKTFTLLAAPGKITYSSQITNKPKETALTSGIGTSSQSTTSNDSTAQTAQTNGTDYSTDIWQETEKGLKALLSKHGAILVNQAAGTITVKDTQPVLRQVAAFVDDINAKLIRQVALSVKVWSVEASDSGNVGVNLNAAFNNGYWKLASGASPLTALSSLSDAGTLTATIVDGKLNNSSAFVQALKSVGKTTQISSGSGIAMNNQPLPVQNVKRQAYVQSVSTTTTANVGSSTAVNPGELNYGFAMTVIPHILDRRRVILQYNVNLSALDGIEQFSTNDNTVSVQLPTVSTRSFSQRVNMKMGQTLVLAGFEQERGNHNDSMGILGAGRTTDYGKTLIVITIEVESMEG